MTVSPLAQDAAIQPLLAIAQATRQAAQTLASLSAEAKNQAIEAAAAALETNADRIVAANQADCEAAIADNLAKPLYGRLKLDGVKLAGAIAGVRDVARLPDPVGTVQIHRELDEGLVLKRLAVPLGVLGVIFESRPDAVMQISALAIKSGNGVILKGGKEAVRSCTALVEAIKEGLENAGVDPAAVQLLTTREETRALLALEGYVDLIIPRGSNAFVRFVQENTRIPVLGHADGICHLYIDSEVNLAQAIAIAVDAKTAYPSACNAIETLLIHQDAAVQGLPPLAAALRAAQVELRGDQQAQQILPDLAPATEEDWATEYSDLILAIKVVASVEEAIAHINTYGSRHTEAIATQNPATAAHFMDRVDAAGVYHNCSTRFADGFRYGFGAEVGISTQKMPPRGPVGLEGLVTYKYQLVGDGHVSVTYSGSDAKPFTHRDLDLQ
ncbi:MULTISPECIES: glutamate-5-semialdehyde dehydrogenase [Cyanophyceae]|uniref:Gamma-glutamyl phosphate reductase n=1 Tax=Leptolyngbya subtilissima DQ-A4 TaxID=2933933 RepID=A0ABV0K869_9CYAN|nr:glutamate-5-semialdehyde dehydrogenase [Nodosilinea sp. FACHB-141]MBD2110618.1 glutamate-5-semialdehyde dehydrogenase [Nodosilinea sp. FACHB-141]